jgi:hypothetical protein
MSTVGMEFFVPAARVLVNASKQDQLLASFWSENGSCFFCLRFSSDPFHWLRGNNLIVTFVIREIANGFART